jgi:hypothetical protein
MKKQKYKSYIIYNVISTQSLSGKIFKFEYYRAFPEDAIQNENYLKTNLTMPVLALGAGYIPTFGGNIIMPTIVYGMQQLAQNVIGVTVPKSGTWIPEEPQDFVIKMLDKFFAGNSIKTK